MLMALNTQKEKLESWLLSPISNNAPIYLRLLWQVCRIAYALLRDLAQGRITLRAMSLVYTTILSVVPLLALSFSLLKVFNFQDRVSPMLYQFFEPMGEKGLEIYNNVLQFVDNLKVGVLGVLGLAMLLYTVMSLIQKVEEAFNTIWHAPASRSIARRFSNYLSAVFLGPILAGLAVSLTAATLNLGLVKDLSEIEPFGSLILFASKSAPYAIIIFGFFLFYLLMPNAKVNTRSAFVGAVVGGVCWQMMSVAFAKFVVGSANYDAVYSGFAVGIVLLIWLYANWLILLLGSAISFYHQNGHYVTRLQSDEAAPELREAIALKVMQEVGERYDRDMDAITLLEVERLPAVPGVMTRKVITDLLDADLITLAGEKSEQLVPSRSTDKISIGEIYQAVRRDRHALIENMNLSKEIELQRQCFEESAQGKLGNVSLRELTRTA